MRRSPLLLGLLALAAAIACWSGGRLLAAQSLAERSTWPTGEDFVLLPTPELAPLVSLGYREAAADVTWARALVYYGATTAEGSDYKYLEQFIDNVIALDPSFKRVYRWASYAVTYKQEKATPEEFLSSLKYLDLAMKRFPDDYEPFWIAGVRWSLDMKTEDPVQRQRNKEKGADLIERAIRKPNAPPDLATLAASLRSRLGQKDRAIRDLREMILLTENKKAQTKMIERLQSLRSEGDPDLAAEVLREKRRFAEDWQASAPWAPPTFFVLLGPKPSPVIDYETLANERDLVGADEERTEAEDEELPMDYEPPPADGD
jgi:hypothetical protein